MSASPYPEVATLPLPLARQAEDVCSRFEAAWKTVRATGPRPAIQQYAQGIPQTGRVALVLALLQIEAHYRRRLGETPQVTEYRALDADLDPAWITRALAAHTPSGTAASCSDPTTVSAENDAGPAAAPVIPGYEILGELGRGGMGVVYKARHIQLDRIVALKVIGRRYLHDAEGVRRFLREMQVAARLAHPNIVTVHDAGQADGIPYFTMEYVEGTNLAQRVRDKGPLPIAQACDYVRQAALGLQHALERGLVHRDVKPANLLVTADGAVVKVLDLGLARVLQPNDGPAVPTLTQAGEVLGTVDFMAPEQMRDARSADTRADLYSLGATLYCLLTGQAPFAGGTTSEKMARHLSEAPRPVASLRREVPPAVAAVVHRLLAKRPEQRYPNPGELAAALAALPARRLARRLWIGIGAAGMLIATALALTIVRWWLPAPQGNLPPQWKLPPRVQPAQATAEEAAAALKKLGAQLEVDDKRPETPVIGVSFNGVQGSDADMVHLEPLTELQTLEPPSTITDAGLRHVQGLKQLRRINLHGAKGVSDAGMACLQHLKEMRTLTLDGTHIGDAGLAHLRNLVQLTDLTMNDTDVTDVGMAHVANLRLLTRLGVIRTEVGDAGMTHVRGLTQLDALGLEGTKVTDAGLVHLRGHTTLAYLEIGKTKVTDVGLQELQDCRGLRMLGLTKLAVTDRGLKHLTRLRQLISLDLNQTGAGEREAQFMREQLPQLQRLNLSETQTNDNALASIGQLTDLVFLNLSKTAIHDEGLMHLRNLKQLLSLELSDTAIHGPGLAHLEGSNKRLDFLDLSDSKIDDAGLQHLAKLSGLKKLNLARTQVGDAGLKHLHPLTQLESVYLFQSKVTVGGADALRKALPKTEITRY